MTRLGAIAHAQVITVIAPPNIDPAWKTAGWGRHHHDSFHNAQLCRVGWRVKKMYTSKWRTPLDFVLKSIGYASHSANL